MTIMSKIKKSKDIHAVLDIGNSKVSCLIGKIDKKKSSKSKSLRFWATRIPGHHGWKNNQYERNCKLNSQSC